LLNWISLSLPISEGMAVYKNLDEKRPAIENTRNFAVHGMHENTLHLPLHTGTHVDYPLHALPSGKNSSDYRCFPVEFTAYVVDLTVSPPPCIDLALVQNLPLGDVEAVFFKTRKSILTLFDPLFPWLLGEAAAWLATFPLKFVGIDQPGIERNQPAHETHIQLLKEDILIFEGLDLSRIGGGQRAIHAFTLGIQGVEAEPVMIYASPDRA
jgi:arylformamidase